jgi:hypothetical protein
MTTTEKAEIADKLRENAQRLAGLSWVVELYEKRGYLTTENQETKYQLYSDLRLEQERLLNELRKGRSLMY